MFAEVDRHVPFSVRRVFAIYGVPMGQERGAHAHRRTHQFVIMLSGSCAVDFNDGTNIGTEFLNTPTQGLHVPPLVWIKLRDFSPRPYASCWLRNSMMPPTISAS